MLAAASVAPARADFAPALENARGASPVALAEALPIGAAVREDAHVSFSSRVLPDLPDRNAALPEQTPARGVRQLPGTPGSASLFLSAMLSVGAYRVLRQARLMHVAGLPEWYHAEAPAQVGHTFAFDLQFQPLAPCLYEAPAPAPAAIHLHSRWPSRAPCPGLSVSVTVRVPRGPPVLHA